VKLFASLQGKLDVNENTFWLSSRGGWIELYKFFEFIKQRKHFKQNESFQ